MIDVKHVSKYYGKKRILSELNLSLPDQKLVAFIGPNGAGKSTVLSLISKLLSKDSGTIEVNQKEVETIPTSFFARQLAILKQSNTLQLNITVEELVNFGRFPYCKGHLKQQDQQKVKEALALLGLEPIKDEPITSLSGGQAQRVYIAMALAQDTPYLLLDEPLNNLDMNYAVQMMSLLKTLVEKTGKTILVVIHDLNFALTYADEVVAMKEGKVILSGPTDKVMTEKHLSELYEMPIKVTKIEGRPFCLYF